MPRIDFAPLATQTLAIGVALPWLEALQRAISNVFPSADRHGAARVAVIKALVVTILVVAIAASANYLSRALQQRQALSPAPAAPRVAELSQRSIA